MKPTRWLSFKCHPLYFVAPAGLQLWDGGSGFSSSLSAFCTDSTFLGDAKNSWAVSEFFLSLFSLLSFSETFVVDRQASNVCKNIWQFVELYTESESSDAVYGCFCCLFCFVFCFFAWQPLILQRFSNAAVFGESKGWMVSSFGGVVRILPPCSCLSYPVSMVACRYHL